MFLVGDADRQRGLSLLRRHYAAGRLTVDELGERVEAVARARTTAQLSLALRGLPGGRALSMLAPRVVALRETPPGAAVAHRAARLVLTAALVAAWLFGSLVMLATLAIAALVAGASAALAAAFTLAWVAMTWLFWRISRAGLRRR